VTNKAGLKTYRDNVETMRNRAAALVKSGKTQADLSKFMTDEYKWAPNSLNQQWMRSGHDDGAEIAIGLLNPEDLAAIELLPEFSGCFLLWPHFRHPLSGAHECSAQALAAHARNVAGHDIARVEYELTGSRLESQFLVLDWARRHLGPKYREEIRLRFLLLM